MKLISVNVGRTRLLAWQGTTVSTGIFKAPVSGRIMLRRTNLDGDRQADLADHGGPDKAAYAYPSEHYAYWSKQFPGRNLPWGAFGENFTTEGMSEIAVSIGDRYRVGSAVVAVKTPRIPCFKLAAKFQSEGMIEKFLLSGYSGFYFAVVEEGEVGAGDELDLLSKGPSTLTVLETFTLYWSPRPDIELLKRAAQLNFLPLEWQKRLQSKLATRSQSLQS